MCIARESRRRLSLCRFGLSSYRAVQYNDDYCFTIRARYGLGRLYCASSIDQHPLPPSSTHARPGRKTETGRRTFRTSATGSARAGLSWRLSSSSSIARRIHEWEDGGGCGDFRNGQKEYMYIYIYIYLKATRAEGGKSKSIAPEPLQYRTGSERSVTLFGHGR